MFWKKIRDRLKQVLISSSNSTTTNNIINSYTDSDVKIPSGGLFNSNIPSTTTNMGTITTGSTTSNVGTSSPTIWNYPQDRKYCPKHKKDNNGLSGSFVDSISLGGHSFCNHCIADLLLESIGEIKKVPDHIPDKQIDRYIDAEVKRNK